MKEDDLMTLKTKCDGRCETCFYQWQVQCAARFGLKNNNNQKILENRINKLEEKLNLMLEKVNDISIKYASKL